MTPAIAGLATVIASTACLCIVIAAIAWLHLLGEK